MKITRQILFSILILVCNTINGIAQTGLNEIPRIVEKNGRHALLVDGKPFFILGGQAHNSSGWPVMMPSVWEAVDILHANTLELPIYWEQIEPKQGQFDFSFVDTLLAQAAVRKIRLVLLWFATWKNGSSHYMPEWMKKNPEKYPHIVSQQGKSIDSPSPASEESLDADKKAFANFMKFLKKADPQHTVIMVQVQNEAGSWGSVRDFSAKSQKLFQQAVPAKLLTPETLKALGIKEGLRGSWQEVFGNNASEYFQAWSVAHYIEEVTASGKAEYPLPMYVNAALRDPLTNPPATDYESGGPTDNVIPIWKAAAPSIDLLAPDIYFSGNEKIIKVLDLYARPDNPLFVPEFALIPENAKYLSAVFARDGIGFSPFGIDANGLDIPKSTVEAKLAPYAREYKNIEPMMREMAAWSFEGKIKSLIEREDHGNQKINLDGWEAMVYFGSGRGIGFQPNPEPNGKIIIVQTDENNFVLTGTRCRISFKPTGKNQDRAWQYITVKEGYYDQGQFKMTRTLNGDETDWGGPLFGPNPVVLKVELSIR